MAFPFLRQETQKHHPQTRERLWLRFGERSEGSGGGGYLARWEGDGGEGGAILVQSGDDRNMFFYFPFLALIPVFY